LRDKVVSKGKVVEVEGLDRGKLLLYSRINWLERVRDAKTRMVLLALVMAPAVTFPIFLLLFAGFPAPYWDNPWLGAALSTVVVTVVFVIVATAIESSNLTSLKRRDTFTALYEDGIQVAHLSSHEPVFIPYEEIVSYRRGRQYLLGTVAFDMKHGTKRRWYMLLETVLGPRGLAVLLERISKKHRPKVAPRLIIYSAQSTPTPAGLEDPDLGSDEQRMLDGPEVQWFD
jgi:hypothetical protein